MSWCLFKQRDSLLHVRPRRVIAIIQLDSSRTESAAVLRHV